MGYGDWAILGYNVRGRLEYAPGGSRHDHRRQFGDSLRECCQRRIGVSGSGVTNELPCDGIHNLGYRRERDGSLSKLNADTKLAALTVSGTALADTLNLTGSNVETTINLGGDAASVASGLVAASLSFTGAPDAVTLGTGAETIDFALQPNSGIETIANFQYGVDQLDINLESTLSSMLHAANTTVGGAHSISIYSSADPTQGIVLFGLPSTVTAANLLSSHTDLQQWNGDNYLKRERGGACM